MMKKSGSIIEAAAGAVIFVIIIGMRNNALRTDLILSIVVV